MVDWEWQGSTEFLGMLGHDVRSPLAMVLGFLKLLEDTDLDEEQRDSLETALICGRETLDMLDGILTVVKGDSAEANASWHDLPQIARDLTRIYRAHAELHNLDFGVSMTDVVPRWWRFDRVRFSQVLANLLGNAVKYTHSGRVILAFSNDTDGLRIDIRDTGAGIAQRDLPRLTRPFQRGVSAESEGAPAGTGLGLAIIQRLLPTLNGAMDFHSREGVGTTISLRFAWASAAERPVDHS